MATTLASPVQAKQVEDIIAEMTRPIIDLLGEPPLAPLSPPRARALPSLPARGRPLRAVAIPLRSLPERRPPSPLPSDAAVLAMARAYASPHALLAGGRVPPDLPEPARKRPRARADPAPARAPAPPPAKRRRKEEATAKPPLPALVSSPVKLTPRKARRSPPSPVAASPAKRPRVDDARQKDPKHPKDARTPKDVRTPKEVKPPKEIRPPKDVRPPKDIKQPKDEPRGIKLQSQPVKLQSQPVKSEPRILSRKPKPDVPSEKPSKRQERQLKSEPRESTKDVAKRDRDVRTDVKKEPLLDSKRDSKDSKQSARKRSSSVPRIPASVVPRSEPREAVAKGHSTPDRDKTTDSDTRANGDRRKKDPVASEPRRLSIPRVPSSDASDRKRREEQRPSSSRASPDRVPSSPERRRPRRSDSIGDRGRSSRDRDTDTDWERDRPRDKPRDRGRDREVDRDRRDRDWDRDRERDRERESVRRSERDWELDRSRDRDRREKDRTDRRDRDRDRDRERERVRDRDPDRRRERERENGRRDDDWDRAYRDRHRDREWDRDRDNPRERERSSARRSLPASRSDSARGSTSAAQSPKDVRDARGSSVTSRPVNRSGQSQSPVSQVPENSTYRPHSGRAELSQVLLKQRDLELAFKESVAKCEELYRKEQYDAFEEVAKNGFRQAFDLGLAKETELRLRESEFKSASASVRAARKKEISQHYRYLTKTYAPARMSELEKVGRKEACAFFKRGIQKVYLRLFSWQRLWEKHLRMSYADLDKVVSDAIKGRNAAKSRGEEVKRSGEQEISTSQLRRLKELVTDFSNIVNILEFVVADVGDGFEEAGTESYIP